jgi:hypothetical protein
VPARPAPYLDSNGELSQEAESLTDAQQAAWDANVQAVIDAKQAIVDAKHVWRKGLTIRSTILKPLLNKQRRRQPFTPEDEALIAEQDDIVRGLGTMARERVRDLEVARARFKAATGARPERLR